MGQYGLAPWNLHGTSSMWKFAIVPWNLYVQIPWNCPSSMVQIDLVPWNCLLIKFSGTHWFSSLECLCSNYSQSSMGQYSLVLWNLHCPSSKGHPVSWIFLWVISRIFPWDVMFKFHGSACNLSLWTTFIQGGPRWEVTCTSSMVAMELDSWIWNPTWNYEVP